MFFFLIFYNHPVDITLEQGCAGNVSETPVLLSLGISLSAAVFHVFTLVDHRRKFKGLIPETPSDSLLLAFAV